MFRCVLRVSIHHFAGLPATQGLEFIAARAGLTMPRCPGMPQVMKAEVADSRPFQCCQPRRIGKLPTNRLTAKGKTKTWVFPQFRFQHLHRVMVQRYAFGQEQSFGNSKNCAALTRTQLPCAANPPRSTHDLKIRVSNENEQAASNVPVFYFDAALRAGCIGTSNRWLRA